MSAFETIRERSKNLLIYGGITAITGAAMVGVGGSVFAQDESTPTASTEDTTEFITVTGKQAAREAEYAAFLDALAVNLGVADGETVEAAIRTTMKQVIDERLAAGQISADLATELKLAIDSGDYPLGFHLPGMGGFGGPGRDGVAFGPRGDDGRGQGRSGDKPSDAVENDATDDMLVPDPGTPTAGATA